MRVSAALLAWVVLALATPARAQGAPQPCNPAVDGTYCAEAGIGSPGGPPSAARQGISGITLGGAFTGNLYDQPATLGALTFGNDGSRCMGLIRRLSCQGGN